MNTCQNCIHFWAGAFTQEPHHGACLRWLVITAPEMTCPDHHRNNEEVVT